MSKINWFSVSCAPNFFMSNIKWSCIIWRWKGQPQFLHYESYTSWFNQWGASELSLWWETVLSSLDGVRLITAEKLFRNGILACNARDSVWRDYIEFCGIQTGGSSEESEGAGQSQVAPPTRSHANFRVVSKRLDPYKIVIWTSLWSE